MKTTTLAFSRSNTPCHYLPTGGSPADHGRARRARRARHAEAVDTSTSHVGFRCVIRNRRAS